MPSLEKFVLITHVAAGFSALFLGIANLLNSKGARLHRRLGMAYFYCMLYVFVSALVILIFYRFQFFLVVIAVFSFYMCFSGYRVLKCKKTGKATLLDKVAAGLTVMFGIGLIGVGVYLVVESNTLLGILSIIFGAATLRAAWNDIRIFRMEEIKDKRWWWYHHMQAMIGSLIAALTAFLVQNGSKFLPIPGNYQWIFWLLPAAIGTPLIIIWIRRYRAQFQKETA